MSDPHRPPIQDFLQQLEGVAPAATDEASQALVNQWLSEHPQGAHALVQRAMGLQAELRATRQELQRVERARLMGQPVMPSQEQLRLQSQAWGRLLGTSSASAQARRQARAQEGAGAPRTRTFEDVGARFMADHVGKMWALLAVLTVVVVLVKERIV
ncbi:MAG: hypothetical protein ACOYLV_09080 [Rubrivivax sp.]